MNTALLQRQKMGVFLALLLPFLTQCNYNVLKNPNAALDAGTAGSEKPILSEKTISYDKVKDAVLIPYCTRCHSKDGGNRGGVNLESYDNVRAQIEDIKADILDGSMPDEGSKEKALWDQQGPAVKEYILKWINLGAPFNETALPASELPAEAPNTEPTVTTTTTLPTPPTTTTMPSTTTTTTTIPQTTTTTLPTSNIPEEKISFPEINQTLVGPYCVKCHRFDDYKFFSIYAEDSLEEILAKRMPPPRQNNPVPDEVVKKLKD